MDCRAAEPRGSTIRRWQWTSEKCLETKRTALVSCLSWLSYPRQYTQNANLMQGLRAACSVFDPLQTARRLNRRTKSPLLPFPLAGWTYGEGPPTRSDDRPSPCAAF